MTLAPDDLRPDVPGCWGTFGLGYAVSHPDADMIGRRFGHGGANGQAFQPERLACAFTCNRMHAQARLRAALEARLSRA